MTTMKAPDAKAPSGDRTFARLLRTAIGLAGHEVFGASGFSTWRADPQETATMEPNAIAAAERLVDLLHTDGAPDAVLTYHNYHKGPDLIGPRISRAFDIPYAIVEASRAQKRADGPWARGFFLADEALRAAHALGVVTRRDGPALEAFAPEAIVPFPPFIDTTPFQRPSTGDGHHVVCAGMMRPGRKAESFRILADVFRIIRVRALGT
ncbi:MAG: glycosyl transferase, partial [Pseudomonadota bacterium]